MRLAPEGCKAAAGRRTPFALRSLPASRKAWRAILCYQGGEATR